MTEEKKTEDKNIKSAAGSSMSAVSATAVRLNANFPAFGGISAKEKMLLEIKKAGKDKFRRLKTEQYALAAATLAAFAALVALCGCFFGFGSIFKKEALKAGNITPGASGLMILAGVAGGYFLLSAVVRAAFARTNKFGPVTDFLRGTLCFLSAAAGIFLLCGLAMMLNLSRFAVVEGSEFYFLHYFILAGAFINALWIIEGVIYLKFAKITRKSFAAGYSGIIFIAVGINTILISRFSIMLFLANLFMIFLLYLDQAAKMPESID